jgi:signal transduction histidine kinase
MKNSKEDLIAELNELKQKYSALELKYNEEIESFRKKENEQNLKLLFFEGIANSTFDGFLVVNKNGQKILQNQRTIDLWKIPRDVVDDPSGLKQVHHVMYMTVNPQQFVSEIDFLREHPNDKTRDELELIDGTVLDRYSSPVIDTEGINYGRIWTFHDITELKNFEKQLVKLNEDKDRFISILAHDLRSPFNSLLGFSELLNRKLREFPIEKIEKMVESIYITAKKTFELLEDTLLWAKIQSKKISFQPSIAKLADVISEVIETLESIAKAKKISIKYSSNGELFLNTDVFILKTILRNLLINAIKFTNEGGSIEISESHIDSNTSIKISDNGVGIKPEILDKLFSITQIKSTQGTANETGTGLGLVLCKELIDIHGGKIWIESKVNQGTTVSFSLPDQEPGSLYSGM